MQADVSSKHIKIALLSNKVSILKMGGQNFDPNE